MFKTREQIKAVSEKTGVPSEHVRKLGQMMSKVKLAQEDLKKTKPSDPFFAEDINNIKGNLKAAMDYFEKEFLECKLW